jgi:hypothetical protein
MFDVFSQNIEDSIVFLHVFVSIKASTSFEIFNCFATIAFNVVIELEQFELEPTALNSNLFPVKANGEVLFLSVLSKRTSEFYLRHLILNLFFLWR